MEAQTLVIDEVGGLAVTICFNLGASLLIILAFSIYKCTSRKNNQDNNKALLHERMYMTQAPKMLKAGLTNSSSKFHKIQSVNSKFQSQRPNKHL